MLSDKIGSLLKHRQKNIDRLKKYEDWNLNIFSDNFQCRWNLVKLELFTKQYAWYDSAKRIDLTKKLMHFTNFLYFLFEFQYVFETEKESEHKKTIHEELVKNLAVSLRSIHDAQVIKNLLKV